MSLNGLFGEYRVILAPMAGVSDSAFRAVCRMQGADLTFTEMVSAKGLSYANEKTRRLLDLAQGETKVGVQLFGHEPETMASQAVWVQDALGTSLAYIDVNMGCPARKIVAKGDGSALMKDPARAASIVRHIKSAVDCKVTAKFRRGWSQGCETAPEFACLLEEAGADALAVHGRFAEQMYRGTADWGCIARVKERVGIPVVGNGGVNCAGDALALVAQTGCDAIMIARAAQGNPWIFAQVKASLEGRDVPAPPSAAERIHMARLHAQMLNDNAPGAIVRMRKHACWYVAGLPGARQARERFNQCTTLQDFEEAFADLEAHLG